MQQQTPKSLTKKTFYSEKAKTSSVSRARAFTQTIAMIRKRINCLVGYFHFLNPQ